MDDKPKVLPLGPVMVAESAEGVEQTLFDHFAVDGWTADERAVFACVIAHRQQAQRVGHRARLSAAWERGDGCPDAPGRSIRDLNRDYTETYGLPLASAAD